MRFSRFLAAAIATIALPLPAFAEEDGQAWLAAVASGAVKGDLFVWVEGQARLTNDFGDGTQFILRPAIGARIAPDAHAIAGYAYIPTNPEGGAATREHRLWQQLQFAPLRTDTGAPLVISRTRLEQRMVEGADTTGWRLRQLVRVQAPIASAGRVHLLAWTEGFLNLNATDFGARRGIDQWRNFVGIGLPVSDRARVEPGYLHQQVFRRGEDRSNHIVSATLTYRL